MWPVSDFFSAAPPLVTNTNQTPAVTPAAPSSAPAAVHVTSTNAATTISWSPPPPAQANGRITGYTVILQTSSQDPDLGVSGLSERIFNTSRALLRVPGSAPRSLRARVAAATVAGLGPFSSWVELLPPSLPPPVPTVTAGLPPRRLGGGGSASRPPVWLVVLLSCLGFCALGGAVVTLHCRRLQRKRRALAGNTGKPGSNGESVHV